MRAIGISKEEILTPHACYFPAIRRPRRIRSHTEFQTGWRAREDGNNPQIPFPAAAECINGEQA